MARRSTEKTKGLSTANDHALDTTTRAAKVASADIARRAYDLYLARGPEHGHDVEDWLQAERELHAAAVPGVRE